jgi:hypothetical protein
MSEPKDKEELPEKTQETEQPPAPRDPDKVVVGMDDEPPDVGPPQQETAHDRQSRRQERRALKDELRASKEAYAKMEKELAELRGAVQRPQQPQYIPQPVYQQREADPTETEISALSDQQDAINLAIANPALAEDKVARLTAQWSRLERQKQELIIERTLKRQGVFNQGQAAPDPFQMQVAMLQAQFPEVYNNPIAMKSADLEYTRMVAAGKPASFATAVEAAQRVRDQSTTRRPAPTDSERSRYTSVPARAGGPVANSNQFIPNKQQLVNARAMYSHLDIPDDDKVRLWLSNVAKKEGLVKNGA